MSLELWIICENSTHLSWPATLPTRTLDRTNSRPTLPTTRLHHTFLLLRILRFLQRFWSPLPQRLQKRHTISAMNSWVCSLGRNSKGGRRAKASRWGGLPVGLQTGGINTCAWLTKTWRSLVSVFSSTDSVRLTVYKMPLPWFIFLMAHLLISSWHLWN